MRCGSLAALGMSLGLAACGSSNTDSARVTIPMGATMRTATDSLAKAGVIGSPKLFRVYAKLRGGDRNIRAGTYAMRRGAGWGEVLTSLRSGRGIVNTVTIPEGFTLAQIEALVAAKIGVPVDSMKAATRDTALIRRLSLPAKVDRLEGYLFPDTYSFPPGTSARAAVRVMVRSFELRWKPEWNARLDSFKLSRHDLMTLASIVEREAKVPQERPVIAAVYWNRLRRGIRLEADPTVQYALPQYQARLLNRHLTINSPYNTYRNAGLPPTPIAAPGLASIEATLFPASATYLFFVAYPDGHHEFRNTLAEHQAEARKARRAWNALAAQTKAALTKAPTPPTR
jgi:UPF0755 protein